MKKKDEVLVIRTLEQMFQAQFKLYSERFAEKSPVHLSEDNKLLMMLALGHVITKLFDEADAENFSITQQDIDILLLNAATDLFFREELKAKSAPVVETEPEVPGVGENDLQ